MARSSWRFGCLAGVSALALVAVAPAGAQSTAQAGVSTLEEVVVTGLRRPQTQQNVPAAVTAFTADAIEMAGIEKPADFIDLTSNVTLVETQNAGNAFIIIRGITQARNSEPSVAVIVDGVQQVNAAQFSQELFDIEQIEVLKGPQGALYGRNAIGGAIVIRTKQPTDEFDTRVKVGVENGFGYSARAGVSGPLSDKVKRGLTKVSVLEQRSVQAKVDRILGTIDGPLHASLIYAHDSVIAGPLGREMREWRPRGRGHDDGLDALAGAMSMCPRPRPDHTRQTGPILAQSDFDL